MKNVIIEVACFFWAVAAQLVLSAKVGAWAGTGQITWGDGTVLLAIWRMAAMRVERGWEASKQFHSDWRGADPDQAKAAVRIFLGVLAQEDTIVHRALQRAMDDADREARILTPAELKRLTEK